MGSFPKKLIRFCIWWILDFPKKLAVITKRFIILLNNRLAFSLSIKLLFTPLFGDYTFIGRLMGFVVRTIKIFIGLIVLVILALLVIVIPLIWIAIPVILFKYVGFYIVPLYFLGLFVIWFYETLKIPAKRISEAEDTQHILTFRPLTLKWLSKLEKEPKKSFGEMLEQKSIKEVLTRAEINEKAKINTLKEKIEINIKNLKQTSFEHAKGQGVRYVELEHLFFSAVGSYKNVAGVLATADTSLKQLGDTIDWIISKRELKSQVHIWQQNYVGETMGGFNRGLTGRVTPVLDSVSKDFTAMAKRGMLQKVIGRDVEIKRLAQLLMGGGGNILLMGEPGSGKSSLIRGIAQKVIEGTEFESLQDKRIVSLEISKLIAGAENPAIIAKKVNDIVGEVLGSKKIIIFMDELENLIVGMDNEKAGISIIFSILEPHLAAGEIQFIGATSISEYRKYIETNKSFARMFQIMEIPEMSKESTLEILKIKANKLENKYNVTITYPAMESTIRLSAKLVHQRVFPDKAINILERTVTRVIDNDKIVGTDDIAEEISNITHIDVKEMTADDAKKFLNIGEVLKGSVIGQEHAIKEVSSALIRSRAGIRNEGKPIASFLFVGTTGVGKTELAKTLTKHIFGNRKQMIRVDMSEYMEEHSVSKLIGAPPGYVGYEEGGMLTNAVRSKPGAVILFDEIEKAHPKVLLLFLQILDEGRLTDNMGVTVSFTNTVVITTSNVGTRAIQAVTKSGGNQEQVEEIALAEVHEHFAPEFLNRFNGIIVFNQLTLENVKDIAKLMLKNVATAAKDKGVKVTFKEELINELAKRGYNPQWGARPLARAIEGSVENYLAKKLLSGELTHGHVVDLGLEVFND